MLPKKYGWGLHFDAEGRIALVAVESDYYKAFVAGKRAGTVLRVCLEKFQRKNGVELPAPQGRIS
jgi:hypothetical protein